MSSRPGGRVAWVSDAKVRGTVIGNEEVESQVRSARDALECKQLVVANLAKRLEPTPQHEPVDYRSPNAVWEALDESGVRLLSARWLTMFSRRAGAVLPRRQDCPPDAFIKPDELRRMFTNACERSSGDGGSSHDAKPRMPIIAVSQIWDADDSLDAAAPAADLETASADAPSARPDDEDDEGGVGTFAHPDPDGNALHLIGRALREHLHVFSAEGYRDVGVYIGWASTFQSPLALSEAAAHARALPYEGFWFAHSLLTSYHCAAVPEDMPPFRARGWNEFEYRLSWLLQQADGAEVDWARVLQLTESASVRPACRPPPPPPGAFDEGGALYHLPFRGGEAKRALAARRLREIVSEALGAEVRLDYSANEWEDAEAEALGEALHLCVRARWLSLAANERLTRLPAKIEHLSGLRTLVLHGCSGLRTLPDSIGGLRELRTLYLTGCASLLALPDALTTLPHLAELDCSRCVSLPQLPERIGSMAALEALLLNGCASLLRLPERMPHLSGLHLAGCSSLTQLPEQVPPSPGARAPVRPPRSIHPCPRSTKSSPRYPPPTAPHHATAPLPPITPPPPITPFRRPVLCHFPLPHR